MTYYLVDKDLFNETVAGCKEGKTSPGTTSVKTPDEMITL
jgi:hypothetical protein